MPVPMSRDFPAEGGAKLIDWVIGAGDDTQIFAGKVSYKNSRVRVANGTDHVELATVADVTGSSSYRGGFSVAAGSLPTKATVTERVNSDILPGQFVLVTVGGTIAGIGGADTLSSGDLLFYLGGGVSTASNWYGVSRGLDLSPYIVTGTVTLASLPANVATRVVPPTSIKTVTSFLLTIGGKVCNGAFEEDFAASGANAGVTLTSLTAKANISCVYTGLTI